MATINVRNMRTLHMRKVILSLFWVSMTAAAFAQFNIHELGRKKIYFGIALGANMGDFKVVKKPLTKDLDTIRGIQTKLGGGFNLGIICNWQFHKYFDLRMIPSLVFSDKSVVYKLKKTEVEQTLSSIYLSFPLLLRFKSDPFKDARFYVIGGVRYDYDLNSNAKTRANNILKINKHNIGVEYGVGFMIYFPNFIMSPEFKMTHSIINMHSPTDGFVYSRVIDKLYPRTFTFTINLEG